MRRSLICAAFLMIMLGASATFAATITLRQGLDGYTGTRDDAAKKDGSYAYENLDDNLYAYSPIYGSFLGAVVGFDVSAIPANATINSATLQMTFSSANFLNGNENAWDVKNPGAQWIEGQVSFHFAQNTGAGVLWEPTDSPFGNFAGSTGIQMVNQPIITSNYISGTNNTGVPLSFDVTSMVSDWMSGSENRGFAIVHERGDPAGHIEWAGKANPNLTWRPTLTVDYTPLPEPASAATVTLLGAATTLRRRHRKTAKL
jgi:hypothetical protein